MFRVFVTCVIILVSYLLGCINGSVMVSHFIIKDDVRKHGSGNAGLTNFYRPYGAKYALMVIGLDMGKTVVACLIGGFMFSHLFGDWTLGVLLGGLGCELGHVFPVFFGFKGGKGILSGSMLAILLGWKVALVAWGVFMLLWALTRYVSLGSLAAAVSLPITVYFFLGHNLVYTALAFFMAALVVYCHRENIVRLLHGTENKFKWHVNPVTPDDKKDEA